MTKSMHDIDVLIREALGRADSELLDELGEQSLPEKAWEVFRGRHRGMNALMTLVILLMFAAAVYSGVRFFRTTDAVQMLRWGAGLFLTSAAVGYLKLWYWMEMERIAVTREVKRLELQIAQLGKGLRAG